MSGSRHGAQGEAPAAPPRKDRIWTAGNGAIRTGWLLAASLFCYVLVAVATRYGLIRAFRALFDVWGVDSANIHLAPVWARMVYAWHDAFLALVFAAATLLIARWLRRLWGLGMPLVQAPRGELWRSALAGVLSVALVAALCLLPDSMRLEWPLTEPVIGWRLPVAALFSLISVTAEEIFTKRVLYDGLGERWNALWASVVVCAVSWLTGGLAGSAVGILNGLLLGWVGCALYSLGGLWTSVGFVWGWRFAMTCILGFGGGEASVYRLYGVSEALLTGGDAGPMHGLWATALLACIAAWTAIKKLRDNK